MCLQKWRRKNHCKNSVVTQPFKKFKNVCLGTKARCGYYL